VGERPYRAKLELTYHCNLRCGFCYTDSPRRTLERTAELDDDAWRRIVGESLELGIGEAVITGGEPLLRREVALEAIERIDAAGVDRIVLNTNGWFIDDAVADSLARAKSLHVHVSIDGPTPELHDAARGVPGSWRRAVRAADLLLARGARVRVLHVITPQNQHALPEFLDAMWSLGVRDLSLTPVVPVGAASRSGGWTVNRLRMYRQVRSFVLRTGGEARVTLENGFAGRLTTRNHTPTSFMIRPNGAFLADSNHPFSFGDAGAQPLAECWEALREGWTDERVRRWIDRVPRNRRIPQMELVPYRDDEVAVAGHGEIVRGRPTAQVEHALEILAKKSPAPPEDGVGDLDAARAHVRELALARGAGSPAG
jgi:MoaA/NifB/PqqE/SkfB family radical SAM enzyme